jgi:hypothetical protein
VKSIRKFLILSFAFLATSTFAQQIGGGYATSIGDFGQPLFSGCYQGMDGNIYLW